MFTCLSTDAEANHFVLRQRSFLIRDSAPKLASSLANLVVVEESKQSFVLADEWNQRCIVALSALMMHEVHYLYVDLPT